jgi:hypothetical protein
MAQALISAELDLGPIPGGQGRAALRVCERLRGPLSILVGAGGFRSLLSRALKLATAKAPWLGGLQIEPDGTITLPAEFAEQLEGSAGGEAATALVAQLLGLLITFIGEALTQRFVQSVYPAATLKSLKPAEVKP